MTMLPPHRLGMLLAPTLRLAAAGAFVSACGSSTHASGSGDSGVTPPRGDATSGGKDSGHGTGGGSGSGTSSKDAGADGAVGKPPADAGTTVSSWLGVNLTVSDVPYSDVTYLLQSFDTPAAQLDANGYPVAGASGTSSTDMGFLLPTGTYKISYKGTGTLTVSGIGTVAGPWQTVSGEQRSTVSITGVPGSFGHLLTLTVTNAGTETVTAIHLYPPGVDYDPSSYFSPGLLAAIAPFSTLRFMGWEGINNGTLANWSDRPTQSSFGQSANGCPYEFLPELINETGKDGWINVPSEATPAFIASFATFMATNLNFTQIKAARQAAGVTAPFQLFVEYSNETWNPGFDAKMEFYNAAQADTTRYTGKYTGGSIGPSWQSGDPVLMTAAQYEADGLVKIGQAFTSAFTAVGQADVVSPVLGGWAAGAAYSAEGLSFIQANYGVPGDSIKYIAFAPYVDPADGDGGVGTATLDAIFSGFSASLSTMGPVWDDFSTIATQYSVSIAAYESGQALTGTTNLDIKHLAQFDVRMHDFYAQYLALWVQHFGHSLMNHFDLNDTPGEPANIYQYGMFGALPGLTIDNLATCGDNLTALTGTESIASVVQYCPKYKAMVEHVPQ